MAELEPLGPSPFALTMNWCRPMLAKHVMRETQI